MDQTIVYGIHTVERILRKNPNKVIELTVITNGKNKRILTLTTIARQHNILIRDMGKAELDIYCDDNNHQGIAAKLQPVDTVMLDEDDLLALVEERKCSVLLILDGVQDPHNLGAILRTADAAGVYAVVVPKDNSVKLTPVVRKVACGAAETVPLITVKNLARFLRSLQMLGMWIIGAEEQQRQTIYDVSLTGMVAIVLGAEGRGLRQLTAKHCDCLVSIPMYGQVESLNVSVAAGICLYEMVRQRIILGCY
jgi:23S rRNA (guanosine2251-2'-O)-methyltransferase